LRSLLPLLWIAAVLAVPRPSPGQADPSQPSASSGQPEYFNERGFRLLQRGAWRAAARQFRAVVQNQPGAAGAWAGLALAQCRLGDLEPARQNAELSRGIDPDQPLMHTAMACLHEAEGDVHGTLDLLERAADSSLLPTYPCRWANHLVGQGQFAEASVVLDTLWSAGHRGKTVASLRARCAIALGDLATAEECVEDVRLQGRNIRAGLALELLIDLSQDHLDRDVIESFPYLVSKTGGGDEIVLLKAEAQRRVGLLDLAEQEAHRHKRAPEDPLGYAVLVRIACDTGELEQAAQILAEAQGIAPLHASLLLSEAYLHAVSGKTEASHRALEMARGAGVPAWDRSVEADVVRLLTTP
jgi:tetratricopeptide (TPR) repeat protein